MRVRINETLKDPQCDLWFSEAEKKDEYVGTIKNQLQLNDVLIQIKNNKLSGYFIYWKGERIKLSPGGQFSHRPKGFYDKDSEQLMELIKP